MKPLIDPSCYQLKIYPPSPNLKEIIQRYEFHSISDEHPLEREFALLPNFDTGLIFAFFRYEPFLLKNEDFFGAKTPEVSIPPPHSKYGYNYGARGMEVIRVIFHPGVMAMLYNTPMDQYENTYANAYDLIDKDLYIMYEHLAGLLTHISQIRVIEQYLFDRVALLSNSKRALSTGSRLFKPLCDLFDKRGYNNRASDIAGEFGWGARNFNRHLNGKIGFSFDTFRRIHRFSSITQYLKQNPSAKLVELAHRFDYADQSHFNKEFKQLSGMNPSQFIQGIKQQRIVNSQKEEDQQYVGILMSGS